MKHIIILCIGFIVINPHLNGINAPLEDRFAYRAESRDSLPAISTTLNIPAVTGSLTIDGKLDDAFWQSARTQLLTNREDAGNPSLPVWLSKQCLKK